MPIPAIACLKYGAQPESGSVALSRIDFSRAAPLCTGSCMRTSGISTMTRLGFDSEHEPEGEVIFDWRSGSINSKAGSQPDEAWEFRLSLMLAHREGVDISS